jgi:hypothetical protein
VGLQALAAGKSYVISGRKNYLGAQVQRLVPRRLVTSIAAKLFRPDLRDVGIGNGQHAFSYVVPPTLKDGRSHMIQVKVTGTNILLNTSPKTLTCESKK